MLAGRGEGDVGGGLRVGDDDVAGDAHAPRHAHAGRPAREHVALGLDGLGDRDARAGPRAARRPRGRVGDRRCAACRDPGDSAVEGHLVDREGQRLVALGVGDGDRAGAGPAGREHEDKAVAVERGVRLAAVQADLHRPGRLARDDREVRGAVDVAVERHEGRPRAVRADDAERAVSVGHGLEGECVALPLGKREHSGAGQRLARVGVGHGPRDRAEVGGQGHREVDRDGDLALLRSIREQHQEPVVLAGGEGRAAEGEGDRLAVARRDAP